jgi:O-antigen/teichoic acid export membrane protein
VILSKVLRICRRLGWGVADQALSSATNFGVGIVVARSLPREEFGAFSLVFTTYLVVLGVSRSTTSEPLLVRFSQVRRGEWQQGTRASSGAALVLGLGGGVLSLVVGLAVGGPLGDGLIALGATLPGLLVQDAWRLAFFADTRGRSAFLNDAVWVVFLVLGFVLIESWDLQSVGWYTLFWGASAGLAALAGSVQCGVIPHAMSVRAWWRRQKDLARQFVGEFVVRSGGTQLITYAVGGILGFTAVGALRAGQILLGPFNILFQGLWLVVIPEQVRLLRIGRSRLRSATMRISFALAGSALVYGLVAQLIPSEIGTALLGPSWKGARSVVLPLAVSMSGLGAVMGSASALRALGAARRSLQARAVTTLLLAIGGIIGAIVGGAVGTALGMAAGYWIGAAFWWMQFLVALDEYAPSEEMQERLESGDLQGQELSRES